MKIALLGNKGLLGSQFQAHFGARMQPVSLFNRSNFDISTPVRDLESVLGKFDVVINCIAYTAVDRAESELDLALMANKTLPATLAKLSTQNGFKLVHFSTDYVFDGSASSAYRINDSINPQNAYGLSKAQGEEAIQAIADNYTIFRTSWLYGEFGDCFPKTISRLVRSRNEIRVVNDQFGQPTWTSDVVDLVLNHIESGMPENIVHATAAGKTSWFDFALEVCRTLGADLDSRIVPSTTASYPTAAQRPAFSVLSHTDTRLASIGDWASRWKCASSQVLGSAIPQEGQEGIPHSQT